jgi:polyisoprenoid-binding protein YceI
VINAEKTGIGTSPWGFQVIGFEASTDVDRKDYGLTWNVALEAGGFLVGDKIKINLEVEAIKQEAAVTEAA